MLRNILMAEGHEIVGEAVNGLDGYEKFVALKPEVVTLDITMPVMDGIEALKQIMIADSGANVIMVSAAGQKSKMVTAIKNGAIEFIQKPFQPEQIVQVINNLF